MGITQNIWVMRVQCGYFIVVSYVHGFLPSVFLSYDLLEDFLSEDTLLVTYIWCTVTFILCIWPIPLWGAVGSHRAALKDLIPRASSVPGQGRWMELSLGYIDCGRNQSTWGKKPPHKHRRTRKLHRERPSPSAKWTQDLLAVRRQCQSLRHSDILWTMGLQ